MYIAVKYKIYLHLLQNRLESSPEARYFVYLFDYERNTSVAGT